MDAIAFDLDGTLIEISKRDYKVYSDIILKFQLIPIPFDIYWNLRINKTNIREILQMSKFDFNNFNLFLDYRNELILSLEYLQLDRVFKNVFKTLEILNFDYTCYIVTTRENREITIMQLNKLGLLKYFSKVFVTTENKEYSFMKIKNLKYVVGDTENDILPAKKLGIGSIAVTTGIRAERLLVRMNPDYIVKDFIEVLDIVKLK